MNLRFDRRLFASLILGAIGFVPSLANADDFRLESATLPTPILGEGGKVNTIIEASGVEPIGDGHRFLVAHDKHPALFVVDTATGRILGPPITSAKFPVASTSRRPEVGRHGPRWRGELLHHRRPRGQDR